jgi:hypothetical protein
MKTTDDLIRIATAGGGLDLRNAGKPTEDLILIAAAASKARANIMIKGNKPTEDLMRIATAGKGCVTIYFD